MSWETQAATLSAGPPQKIAVRATTQPVRDRSERNDGYTSSTHHQWLERVIETEIIPRLILAHRTAEGEPDEEDADALCLSEETVREFAALVLEAETPSALAYLEGLNRGKRAPDALVFDLLAHTARRLGRMWEEDLCDFTEVTLGLARLHSVLRRLSVPDSIAGATPKPDRRILVLPVFGEQHIFGALMVGEFFRRAGWSVWGDPGLNKEDVLYLLREQVFSVVGLSISAERWMGTLASSVAEIREASCNKEVKVIVGGKVVVDHPDVGERAGADAIAVTGRQAVLTAERLVCSASGARPLPNGGIAR